MREEIEPKGDRQRMQMVLDIFIQGITENERMEVREQDNERMRRDILKITNRE